MSNFLINNAHIIIFVVWETMAVVALLRYFEIRIFKRLSWGWLVSISIAIHIIYSILISWGQYILWSQTEATKIFIMSPLPNKTPLLWWTEIFRPYFELPHGYFIFYSLNHFFLSVIVLFFATVAFYILLLLWSKYNSYNFRKYDILIVVLTLLIAGWLGLIVLIPISFIILIICSFVKNKSFKEKYFHIPLPFLVAVPFVLVLTVPLLKILNLYTLLKI